MEILSGTSVLSSETLSKPNIRSSNPGKLRNRRTTSQMPLSIGCAYCRKRFTCCRMTNHKWCQWMLYVAYSRIERFQRYSPRNQKIHRIMPSLLPVKRYPSITIRRLARILVQDIINRINPCCHCIMTVLIVLNISMPNLILILLIHAVARLLNIGRNV